MEKGLIKESFYLHINGVTFFFCLFPDRTLLRCKMLCLFHELPASLQPSITPSCKYSYIHDDVGLVTKITR